MAGHWEGETEGDAVHVGVEGVVGGVVAGEHVAVGGLVGGFVVAVGGEGR